VSRSWLDTRHNKVVEEHGKRIGASLENDVFPEIGRLPISEVKPSDVLSLLRKVETRGALDTVKRLCQRISDIFIFANSPEWPPTVDTRLQPPWARSHSGACLLQCLNDLALSREVAVDSRSGHVAGRVSAVSEVKWDSRPCPPWRVSAFLGPASHGPLSSNCPILSILKYIHR
jgi:integrase-like protein